MFETLKKMFCAPHVKDDVHPTVKRLEDALHNFESKVEVSKKTLQEDTSEKKPDISEPVISFVEVVKNNPGRFKSDAVLTDIRGGYFIKDYTIIDKFNGNKFSLRNISRIDRSVRGLFEGCVRTVRWIPAKDMQWITQDEVDYVVNELQAFFVEWYTGRKERINAYKRKKLISVYCKERTE